VLAFPLSLVEQPDDFADVAPASGARGLGGSLQERLGAFAASVGVSARKQSHVPATPKKCFFLEST